MKSRFKEIILYFVFFSFCFSIFMYHLFPYDALKDFVSDKASKNPALGIRSLSIKELEPYWFTGIEFKGLKLVKRAMRDDQIFKIDSGMMRIAPGSLLSILMDSGVFKFNISDKSIQDSINNNLVMRYKFKAYGGGGEGYIDFRNAKTLNLKSGSLNLGRTNFLSPMLGGGRLTGLVKQLDFSLFSPDGKLNSVSGKIALSLNNGSVQDVKIIFLSLPQIKISSLDVNIKAKKGQLSFNKFRMTGDVEGKISGTIKLEPNLMYSKLKLNMRITPSQAILKNFKSMLDAFMRPNRDGVYIFDLVGTLGQPQIKK